MKVNTLEWDADAGVVNIWINEIGFPEELQNVINTLQIMKEAMEKHDAQGVRSNARQVQGQGDEQQGGKNKGR